MVSDVGSWLIAKGSKNNNRVMVVLGKLLREAKYMGFKVSSLRD